MSTYSVLDITDFNTPKLTLFGNLIQRNRYYNQLTNKKNHIKCIKEDVNGIHRIHFEKCQNHNNNCTKCQNILSKLNTNNIMLRTINF